MVYKSRTLKKIFKKWYTNEPIHFALIDWTCHTKDDIKMVPVVPLFSTEHSKEKILALSQELR